MAGGSALLGEAVSTFGEVVGQIKEAISRLVMGQKTALPLVDNHHDAKGAGR